MSLRVGLVGCGDISGIYFRNAALFADFRIVACASRRLEQAERVGSAYGVPARSVDALIEGDDIDIVLNLTPPVEHASITRRALLADKHVYSEKPLGVDLAEAFSLADLARHSGVRLGVAPDTVLGTSIQLARQLIAEGAIGRPLFGTSAFLGIGPELYHPSPDFFYLAGGGPTLDMGPYYLSTLTSLLGGVGSVVARSVPLAATRVIDAPTSPRHGNLLTVAVPTTTQSLLIFDSGVTVSFLTSWDVHHHGVPHIEIHGTEGSIRLPNPDWFGGDVLLSRTFGKWEVLPTHEGTFGKPNRLDETGAPVADYRGLGLADMAQAIRRERRHRANDAIGVHVVAIVDAMMESIAKGAPMPVVAPYINSAPLSEEEATELRAGGEAAIFQPSNGPNKETETNTQSSS
jgi:predicted dehydrogenase